MKILITGGAGSVGSRLAKVLLEKGHEVVIFDLFPPRFEDPQLSFVKINLAEQEPSVASLVGIDAVFHLAGKSIFGKWSPEIKEQMYESRVKSAENLISAFRRLGKNPKVFITASGIAYYGEKGEEEIDESSSPGKDFLSRLCLDWERAADTFAKEGVRVVALRTALVLSLSGMLAQLLPIYKWGLGGPLGSGRQWVSWIHVNDLVSLFVFCMENESVRGAVNASSPHPVRQKEFTKTFASILHRPAFIPTPAWVLRLKFGDFTDVILESQKASSKKIQGLGFRFAFPSLREALVSVLES